MSQALPVLNAKQVAISHPYSMARATRQVDRPGNHNEETTEAFLYLAKHSFEVI